MGMLKQLLSVFLEFRCPLCQRTAATTICEYCLRKLSSHQFKPKDRYRQSNHTLPIFAWGKYEGQLKRAIALMKYDLQPEIGIVLGELLGQAWLDSNSLERQKISVVPIPLHQQKLRDRGFNQAEVIARGFCQLIGYSLNSQTLIRVRETQAMYTLSPEQRASNLQDAFRVSNKLPKYPVLLLDDIYTTGTTIAESVRVLQQKKIKVVGVVVVARTEGR